jgi:lipopolysaccharide heptosyltransferase I
VGSLQLKMQRNCQFKFSATGRLFGARGDVKSRKLAWPDPEVLSLPARPKVLLVRFSALGDVIQTLPILPLIRQKYPDAYVGWAIDADLVHAIEGHDLVDQIHPCHRKRWSKDMRHPLSWAKTLREMNEFAESVRSVGYDVALDVQGLFKTGLLTFFSGAKHRIGFAHGRELSTMFYQKSYIDRQHYFDPSFHHVDHMALLTRVLGSCRENYSAPLPPVTLGTEIKMASMLDKGFTYRAPIVALAPGTQWESKRWSDTHWIELVHRILNEKKFNILFVGSPADKATVARILEKVPASPRILDLSGKTSIRELYALFPKIHAAIAADTAPLHIAAAAGTPHVIGLFGPTSVTRTSPIGSPDTRLFSTEGQLSCQPCHKRVCPLGTGECLERISAESIFAALLETVKEGIAHAAR